ncbi:MAG: hypothetical protein KAI25_08370, partial [Hyphomicrobiaceae bacterium]|nr:hypothetical protein [Hyphomicrobiaceae bacterium]
MLLFGNIMLQKNNATLTRCYREAYAANASHGGDSCCVNASLHTAFDIRDVSRCHFLSIRNAVSQQYLRSFRQKKNAPSPPSGTRIAHNLERKQERPGAAPLVVWPVRPPTWTIRGEPDTT